MSPSFHLQQKHQMETFSKLITLDLHQQQQDLSSVITLIEAFLDQKIDTITRNTVDAALVLLWRCFSVIQSTTGSNNNFENVNSDDDPFTISLFEVLSVDNHDEKESAPSSSILQRMLNGLFRGGSNHNRNVIIDLTSIEEESSTNINNLLSWIETKGFKALSSVGTTTNNKLISQFRMETSLFVVSSSSSRFDELILEDDIKPLLTVPVANNNNTDDNDDEAEKLNLLRNIILSGVHHIAAAQSDTTINNDDENDDDEATVIMKTLCRTLVKFPKREYFNNNNESLMNCWIRSHCRNISSSNTDATFLPEFIMNDVVKPTMMNNNNSNNTDSLLSLVSLFGIGNNNADESLQIVSSCSNKMVKIELTFCLLQSSLGTFFTTNSSVKDGDDYDDDDNYQQQTDIIDAIIEYIQLLLILGNSSQRGRIVICLSGANHDEYSTSSHRTKRRRLFRELNRQKDRMLDDQEEEDSPLGTFLELVNEIFGDVLNDDDNSFLVNETDLITTLAYACQQTATPSQKATFYGLFLRNEIMKNSDDENNKKSKNHHQNTLSNSKKLIKIIFALLKIFCRHLLLFANNDDEEIQTRNSKLLHGLCCMLMLEGFLEPLFEKESTAASSSTLLDSSLVIRVNFCRLFTQYMTGYLLSNTDTNSNKESDDDVVADVKAGAARLLEDSSATEFKTFLIEDLLTEFENDDRQNSESDYDDYDDEGQRQSGDDDEEDDYNSKAIEEQHQHHQMTNNSTSESAAPTTTSLATRMKLLSLQKTETQQRTDICHEALSVASEDQAMKLQFWTSSVLQLHIEFFRDEIWSSRFLQKTMRTAIENLWFAQAVELKSNIVDKNALIEKVTHLREGALVLLEEAFSSEVLFPMTRSRLELLLEESNERKPLMRTATSYSSLSWLFEEEKVVRSQVIMADEEEDRINFLQTAFEQMCFIVSTENTLRTQREQELAIHEEIFIASVKSVFEKVLVSENENRDTIQDIFLIENEQQSEREEIEEDFFNIFMHDLLVLKRKQERFINQLRDLHVEAFKECSLSVFESWSEFIIESNWEEGVEHIYAQREEEGEDSILLEAQRKYLHEKQQQQHHQSSQKKFASSVSDKKNPAVIVEEKQTGKERNIEAESSASSLSTAISTNKKPTTTKLALPLHVAKSVLKSELVMRREIRAQQDDEEQRLMFWLWRKKKLSE